MREPDDDPMSVLAIRRRFARKLAWTEAEWRPLAEASAGLIPALDRAHPGREDFLDEWHDIMTEA